MLAWGAPIPGFRRVVAMLRLPNQFQQTFAQLRFAHWLSQHEMTITAFEPLTVGQKRADIRCVAAGQALDVEVVRPQSSHAYATMIARPIKRLTDAFAARPALETYSLSVIFPSGMGVAAVDEKTATTIVDILEHEVCYQPLSIGDTRDVTIPGVSFRARNEVPDWRPDSEPLIISLQNSGEYQPTVSIGHDMLEYQKPPRHSKAFDDDLDWLLHLLVDEAQHFGPERYGGIIIDDTQTSDLFARKMTPFSWGWEETMRAFWEEPISQRVLFVATAMANDNGFEPITDTLDFNPNHLVPDIHDVAEVWSSLWRSHQAQR